MIATAESGMEQSSNVLQRIRELAIQAANDTLINADRSKIQEEITQLRLELTRIAETTEFNTRKLLDGSVAGSILGENAKLDIEQNVRVGDTAATVPSIRDFISSAAVSTTGATMDVAFQLKFISYQGATSDPVSVAIEVRSSIDGVLTTIRLFNSPAAPPTQILLSLAGPTGSSTIGSARIGTLNVNANSVSLADIGKTALVQITAKRAAVTVDSSLTFHVGANEGQFLKAGINDLRGAALRVETLNVVGSTDEDSRTKAQNVIGVVDQALDYINSIRARLGAFQNRLEFTISNLQVSKQSLASSESRIRDADMAAETANLTRAQILVQAGTAVLSQANVSSSTALSLLQ